MLRFRTGLVALGLLGWCAACGGSVVEGGPNGETGGAAGAAAGAGGAAAGAGGGQAGWGGSSQGGWGGAAGTSPGGGSPGGSGGSPIPDAGPDAPPTCAQTHDKFSMNVSIYDGTYFGCPNGVSDDVFEINGAVFEAGFNYFLLDSCPPNADCMPMFSKFSFEAPDLSFAPPVGAFVNVRLKVTQPWGCTQQIEITNLPTWGGVDNPFGKQKLIYLSAADGVAEAVTGSDIAVHKQALGCINNEPGCGGDPPDMYTLYFGAIWQSSLGMPVPMGTAALWSFKGQNFDQLLTVRNLRSYSSGMCDDYWNWAWWVTQAAVDL